MDQFQRVSNYDQGARGRNLKMMEDGEVGEMSVFTGIDTGLRHPASHQPPPNAARIQRNQDSSDCFNKSSCFPFPSVFADEDEESGGKNIRLFFPLPYVDNCKVR